MKTGLLASHVTTRVDTDIRKGGMLTTARLLSNSGVTSFARLAILDPPQRAEALRAMTAKERKEALASMTPELRAETQKALKSAARGTGVGSTSRTQSKGASPNPALDYRKGETQRSPGKDEAWRLRTLELEKGHKKSDNTVRYKRPSALDPFIVVVGVAHVGQSEVSSDPARLTAGNSAGIGSSSSR